jgi:hypothetical protein
MAPFNSREPSWFDYFNSRGSCSNIKDLKLVQADDITEPVTLAQAKDQLRISFTDDDTIVTSLITQARKSLERYCCISMVNKTASVLIDLLREVELPYGPVVDGITSFTDSDGNTIDPSYYQVIGVSFKIFRPTYRSFINAVVVYDVGMDEVEDDLQLAILQEIAFRYEHRGDDADTRKSVNPGVCEAAQILAAPFIRETWR